MQPDIGIIIAIIGSAFGIIAVVIAMFFWVRSEANSDRREFHNIQREDRKDLLQIARSMEIEMKDFHNQLIEIKKSGK